MPQDGITKALAVVRRIGKATPKLVGAALPVAAVGVRALSAWNEGGKNLDTASRIFIQSYIPIDVRSGEWRPERIMTGLGTLLISLGVGKLISYLA